MMYFNIPVVIILLLVINYSHGKELPSFIKRCKYINEGNAIGKCIQKVFEENKERFMKGIPEMRIPPLDPFLVDRVEFNTGNGTAIGMNAVFKNLVIEGAKDTVWENLDVDLANHKVVLETRIPHLRIKCDYTVNGRIMIVPINGSGQADSNFTDIHSIGYYTSKLVTRKGKEYIDWTDQNLDLTIGGASLNLDNLFNGNKVLTETTNKVLNDNYQEIIKELQPLVKETILTITYDTIKHVYHDYSIDELFERV